MPDSRSGLPAMASPPLTRARSGSAAQHPADLDSIVEAVVTRLISAGLLGAAAAPPTEPQEEKPVVALDVQVGPSLAQRRVWLEELRSQQTTSTRFGPREKEEVRALLIIGDGGGPPTEHSAWYWGRIRLMLIVAHHGWAAAISDAQHSDMDRLGIRLSTAAVQPAAAPPPVAESGRRGRPSRPSGLRPPPRRASSSASARRAN